MTDPDPRTTAYSEHRPLLFTIAYEMLGSVADAEDVVSEVWPRWSALDDDTFGSIEHPRAYLVTITTRLALNRLRTVSRQREEYVGPWLPEPLLASPDIADTVADSAELADALSTAMLLVLETLAPVERAVFVLREVFDTPYPEIAAAVEKSEAAVRQIASRAKRRVAEQRPRVATTRDEHAAVTERFRVAALTGDIAGLLDVLSPDVVLHSDGGGLVSAARRPIRGRDHVLRFLAGIGAGGRPRVERIRLAGEPALAIYTDADGPVDAIGSVRLEDGLVAELYLVRNPEKLAGLSRA